MQIQELLVQPGKKKKKIQKENRKEIASLMWHNDNNNNNEHNEGIEIFLNWNQSSEKENIENSIDKEIFIQEQSEGKKIDFCYWENSENRKLSF